MALTVKRAGAAEYGAWVKMIVLGAPGAGKTRTASTWPNVLYANCEAGMMSVADRQPAVIDISTYAEIKELLSALKQPPAVREKVLGVPVDTIVIDTLDEVARMLVQERLASERRDAFQQADWGWLGDQLRNMVRAFRNLEMHVIFNVHIKSTEDSETGRTFFKAAIQGAMGDELPAYADLVMYMVARPVMTPGPNGTTTRTVSRYFQTYPDAQHEWVKDRSGKLPMEFPITFDDDFTRIHGLVYKDVPAASTTVGQVATPAAPAPDPEPPKRTTGAHKDPQGSLPDAPPQPAPDPPAPEPASAPAEAAQEPPAAPEPTPEPETAPEPEKAPEPAPEPTPEPTPAGDPEPETVPDTGTPPEPTTSTAVQDPPADLEDWQKCQGCDGTVENKDQADLSFIRYKEHLCRKCFADRKKTKR